MISSPDSSPTPDVEPSPAPEEHSSQAPHERSVEHREKSPLLKAFSESLALLATP